MTGLVPAVPTVAIHTAVDRFLDRVAREFVVPPPAEGRVRDHVVQVFIVAVAVLLALGMTLAAGIAIYCIQKGYRRVEWFGPNGWKVWQMKVACSK